MADPATDRRAQNFKRFFEQSGWSVEIISISLRTTRGPKRFLEYDQALARAVRNRFADVVMACDLFSLTQARRMKNLSNAKVLLYDAREVYTELPHVADHPIKKWIWRRLERRGLMETDFVIVTGPRDVQAICNVHDFLPRPVMVRNLPWHEDNLERDRSLLTRFGIPPDVTVAVYVGGLQEGRGLPKLVQVFQALPEKHLLLIGDGKLRQGLELMATPNVHFAGAVPAEEAMRLVASCDAGISLIESISPSYALGLPSKVFEYMMSGIPVVSSRLLQVLDLFEREQWIFFVDVNDPTSIRRGIESAFATGHSPIRDRERSLALAEYHFAHDAEKLLTLLRTIPL